MTDPILEQLVAAARKRAPKATEIYIDYTGRASYYRKGDEWVVDSQAGKSKIFARRIMQMSCGNCFCDNYIDLSAPDLPALLSKLGAEDGA